MSSLPSLVSTLVSIGTVSKLHGFKGSLVVFTSSGKESSLGFIKRIWLGTSPSDAAQFALISSDWMPKGWKITLENIHSEEQARHWVGKTVFAERSELPPLETNEFYLSDLIGLLGVESTSGNKIGFLNRLEESSHTSSVKATYWVFKTTKTEQEECFIPAVAHYIEKVDLLNKIIYLRNLQDLATSSK